MRHAIKWLLAFPFLVVVLIGSAYTITNTFSSGTTAVASQVNANFSAAKTAIDDNDSRITALEAVDTSAELRGVLTDETGTGAAVFAGGAIGAATATTPSVDDNDTSVATTAFVQAETVAAGDVTGTLGSGLTIGSNAVALSTDTTGNYVATIADSGASEVTVSGSGSEGAAVTLAIASSITRDSELSAYTVGTSAPVDGSTACVEGDMYLDHTANKIYFCVDDATDDWFGVALTDTP